MTHSPLEDFVLEYAETLGGAWEEVEPQVYDLLLPAAEGAPDQGETEQQLMRVTFDPEAVPDHPGCQLASFGTPLIDRLLADARRRGCFARFHFLGLNLTPHDLVKRASRPLSLEGKTQLHIERVRALDFPQALWWFQATFVSDQREQEILTTAMDLHQGRLARHHDKLLDQARLSEQPSQHLSEAPHISLAAAYPVAREEALRTLVPLAHARNRDLRERLDRQVSRMQRYYADLRLELDDLGRRGTATEESQQRLAARRQAIDHEEQLRIAELRQKNSLRVQLALLATLVIYQPKLLLRATLLPESGQPGHLDLVWDPLLETLEAATCPLCQRPSFALGLTRLGQADCAACSTSPRPAARPAP